jgi:endoglucanase
LGNTAIHLREKDDEKIPEVHQLYVDIGANSKKDVEKRGIRVGHPAVYADTAEELIPGRIIGRAIDNRISGFILSQVLANLSQEKDKTVVTVHAVNAVQEEIGGSGAKMIAYRLQPRVAIVIDVTHATDSPGVDKNKHGFIKLGGGPTPTHGTANHPLVVGRLIDTARELEVPIQHEAWSPGTDADRVYTVRSGIASALVSIPMRYMHSTIEMIELSDVELCILLLTNFIRKTATADQFMPKLV